MSLIIVLSLSSLSFSSGNKIEGKVFDKSTGKGISFAGIRLDNSTSGTSANLLGCFELSHPSESTKFITSCIGYKSDTATIDNKDNNVYTNIYLNQINILQLDLQKARKPNTALEIIQNAVESKGKENEHLLNYEFEAYNKFVLRENNGIGFGTGNYRMNISDVYDEVKESFNLVTRSTDSLPMRIKSISEDISKGFYSQPDVFREIIEAKTTRANMPAPLSELMGNRIIQNFKSDELKFFNRSIPGPISETALTYYKFELKDTLPMDNKIVYKIYLEPLHINNPGFIGFVYIEEETFNLIKVELELNHIANTGGTSENVTITQQFLPFANSTYLPVDYHIRLKSSYIGIARMEYELSSVIYNYKINNSTEDLSGRPLLTVLPGAEKKDSAFWKEKQIIPFTPEELRATAVIDSMKYAPRNFIETSLKVFSPQYQLNDHFSVSGPFGIYQFNHVEGHTLYFSASGYNLFNNKIDTKITLSNGFSDKKFKEKLLVNYYPDEERQFRFSLNAYNKLAVLFTVSDQYSPITSTFLSLISNRDFRNYYYTKGFSFAVEGEFFNFLLFNMEYANHTDITAYTTTDYSLFGLGNRRSNNLNNDNSTITDSVNAPIYDARINTISFGVNFDFRNVISDNNIRRRVSEGNAFATFGAGIQICDPKILKSSIGYVSYSFEFMGGTNTFKTANLGIKINGVYSNGPVPYQMQYALPGNIGSTGRNFTFRSVGVRNMFGDQALTLNLEHNFRKEIFKYMPIAFMKNIVVNTFFNAAWKNMSDKSAAIMPVDYSTLRNPLYETGFSLGYSSIPASLEFAWRLNHIERSSFSIGINTSIL